jgi:hypothetical protein
MLVDALSSVATRRRAELSECLRRLRRGRQQIRSIASGLPQVGFKPSCEKQRRLQGVRESVDECFEFVVGHDVSSNHGLFVVPSRQEEPDSPCGGHGSSQRRPNTAAVVTGRASRSMLARREAPGDGGGVLVQRTTAALTSQESTPTTRLTNVFAASAPTHCDFRQAVPRQKRRHPV